MSVLKSQRELMYIEHALDWFPYNLNEQCLVTADTALHLAVKYNLTDVVNTLIKVHGPQTLLNNIDGFSPKALAIFYKRKHLVALFDYYGDKEVFTHNLLLLKNTLSFEKNNVVTSEKTSRKSENSSIE